MFPAFLERGQDHGVDHGEPMQVQTQDEYSTQYRNKASECLDLANRTGGGPGGTWNRFLGMAMLWLRLAEESERLNRLEVPGQDRR
jgi:hypothetical protein